MSMKTDKQPGRSSYVLAAAGPALCIAMSYVGPGKWAASVEGGAMLGYGVSLFVLAINFVAILCQYLSACVAVATSKDLAQICREEYDNMICVWLGIQAEISMILLDLSMVLGTAYCLFAIFGIDLSYCIFLSGFDAAISPLFAHLLGNPNLKFLPICLACFGLLSYFFGALITQPERSLLEDSMLYKLSGENCYALMSLLGASVMPHNFYLHSSIVQMDQGQAHVSKAALCHYHFFAILCIFSGIYLADCMLLNLSANVFYDSGLVSLGLQDALSLLEQVFRSSAASFALLIFMFFFNHLIPLTWSIARQAITQDFFRVEIPGWLHRAMIRLVAMIPALYCVWNAGAEGVFQLLIFTQVVVAILLPSSVIPLFRVASCRSIMGAYKVSQVVEVLAVISFTGILGLKIVFVMEMIFGTSEWVSGLNLNFGSVFPVPNLILLTSAFASIVFLLFLLTTPLRSASGDVLGRSLEEKEAIPELSLDEDKAEISEVPFHVENSLETQEDALQFQKSIIDRQDLSIPVPVLNLPETLLEFDGYLPLSTAQDGKYEIAFSKADESDVSSETVTKVESPDASTLSTETESRDERTLRMEFGVQTDKDDDLIPQEPQVLDKEVAEGILSSTSEGPGSSKSFSGRTDDLVSSPGSLSRLGGLGRSARRQLTSILDDFWGQLFGYHGEATDDAKAKKLDVLIGVDPSVNPKLSAPSVKMEAISKEPTGFVTSNERTASESFRSSTYVNSFNQLLGQGGGGSVLDGQQRPSVLSEQMKFSDLFGRNSSINMADIGERRYYSVRTPISSYSYDQQPATIHGYSMSSYLDQAREIGAGSPKSQLDTSSTPSVPSNSVNSYATRHLSQKPLSGLRNFTPPGFHNVPAARNNALKPERYLNDLYSSEASDCPDPNVKKYYSLPDISGLYIPRKESTALSSSRLQGSSMMLDHSVGRSAYDQTSSPWTRTAYGFNDVSTPKVPLSLQFGSSSVWSKQPYEQFGVAGNSPQKAADTAPVIDVEAKLLQSFRSCIIKLVKLEGSDWLFSQNDGVDEDIISKVASREKFLNDIETRTLDRKLASPLQMSEADQSTWTLVPNCGEGCVWSVDIIISFGVWCMHRILDLSLVESRPELWGKYTYVLNRLQGIIDPAFSKPRSPRTSCFCLLLPFGYQQQMSSSHSSSLPPPAKVGNGKLTTAATLLDLIKDVEIAVSSRKGRSGTAAGDVAFPKGKENLASVLKRYKRRLANKTAVGSPEAGRKPAASFNQGPGIVNI